MLYFASWSHWYLQKKSAETRTDCIYIDLALPMDFTVVSFTLAVNNHGCGWLNLKIIPTICQFL